MSIADFPDELAAVTFAGVNRRYDDIPKELKAEDLPAQWVEMPTAFVAPTELYGTFEEAGSRYVCMMFIAVATVAEGFPADQRAAVLTMAARVEAWAKTTPYATQITTSARIPVGSREYRGVGVQVTADAIE
jgi:hypothetical protein